jgi:CPA2 family monovalent cation:H+ antiporter-2
MLGETHLLATIAIGLSAAFIGGYLARLVKLPAIVGYLVAGMAIGPFTPGIVADSAIATELAELGIVLLMFGVGLHFSFRDLWDVRRIAAPGAIGQITFTTVLGTVLGMALGWGPIAGFVLGLSLSVASTVVLLRALTDRQELDTGHGRIAIGWLIVQDIFTILTLVLLPTVAVLSTGTSGETFAQAIVDVVLAIGRAGLLVVLMFVVGTRVVPRILLSVARDGSRELFTLAVLAAAIGLAFVSSAIFGVSLALGAFLAGAVLAESDMSHQAASEALPMRDAFAVLFFVSVGMLVNPTFLLAHPLEVGLAVAIVVLGNSLGAFAIVTLAGHPSRTALTVAAGVAQIGEFSFILATLAVSLGLLPGDGFQLVVAAALLSITANQLVFAVVDRVEPRLREASFLRRWRLRPRTDLMPVPLATAQTERRHAVVIGHGRVGALIAWALERRGFGYVVIEQNRRVVEALREGDRPTVVRIRHEVVEGVERPGGHHV